MVGSIAGTDQIIRNVHGTSVPPRHINGSNELVFVQRGQRETAETVTNRLPKFKTV